MAGYILQLMVGLERLVRARTFGRGARAVSVQAKEEKQHVYSPLHRHPHVPSTELPITCTYLLALAFILPLGEIQGLTDSLSHKASLKSDKLQH